MGGIEFQRDDLARGADRASEPDRAVSAERSDLENIARQAHSRQKIEELALVRRHVDGRETGLGVGGECRVENRIFTYQRGDKVTVDFCPIRFAFHSHDCGRKEGPPQTPLKVAAAAQTTSRISRELR